MIALVLIALVLTALVLTALMLIALVLITLVLFALVFIALVFIAPVLWILEAVPVPLAGPLDVLPANLLLRVVARARIRHQGPRATRSGSRRATRIQSISDRKKTEKVALTLHRWGAPGRLIWLVSRAVGGGAID